jgi:hypothetical protein
MCAQWRFLRVRVGIMSHDAIGSDHQRRDGFKRALDAYCGLCIVGLYFLYLGLAKGAFSLFDCTQNKDGTYILDADPSIKCDEVGQNGSGRWIPSFTHQPRSAVVAVWCVQMLVLQAGSVQEALKPAAALSIVVYTLGLPVAFLTILIRHRGAIHADQTLRVANEGESEATNPNFHIRRRYQELYRCGRGVGFYVTSQVPVVEV